MSKGRLPDKTSKPAPRAPSIAALRVKIDRIDRELVARINERAKLAHQIGKIKDANGQRCYDPVREEEVLAKVIELSRGPLSNSALRNVFRELISGSRALERALRVAYLGPEYSYSHLAAIHRFGQSVELVPVASISAVFEEVNQGHAQYGLVPLENSTDGRVTDTLDMFTRLPVQISGEVQLRIHHYLLGRCDRSEVQEVYSKPQALSQCRNWLSKHLPNARAIDVTSTSTAAQLAHDKPGAAAVASLNAGMHYGLSVLAENIEDVQGNLTRFAVISEQSGDRSGSDKTSLMFEIAHKPGSLADAMNIFKRARLNLTWIESFPIARPEGGYMFFVELEGHQKDSRVRKACEALEKKCLRMVILGSYARSPIVE
ncbi:MAG: prephenate dehydratase [Planctomycetota bacterium]|nr:prephenate dehydratase [Planctomycetota bacterium]